MGIKTIGVGFNLEDLMQMNKFLVLVKLQCKLVVGLLTTEQIYQLLDKDIDTAILTAKLYLKTSQP
jgi:hypothetical protein